MMYACVGGLEHACSITRTDSAASKSKARSEGPTRPAGPERSGVFALRSCAPKRLKMIPAGSEEHLES